MHVPLPDSHVEADKLWKQMLASVFSMLDTVERTIKQERYSNSLKKALAESMQVALEGLKDLKDLVPHLEVERQMPAIEELKSGVERTGAVMEALKAWVGACG